MKQEDEHPLWHKRLLWFVLIWLASVLTLVMISYGLRFFFNSFYN